MKKYWKFLAAYAVIMSAEVAAMKWLYRYANRQIELMDADISQLYANLTEVTDTMEDFDGELNQHLLVDHGIEEWLDDEPVAPGLGYPRDLGYETRPAPSWVENPEKDEIVMITEPRLTLESLQELVHQYLPEEYLSSELDWAEVFESIDRHDDQNLPVLREMLAELKDDIIYARTKFPEERATTADLLVIAACVAPRTHTVDQGFIQSVLSALEGAEVPQDAAQPETSSS